MKFSYTLDDTKQTVESMHNEMIVTIERGTHVKRSYIQNIHMMRLDETYRRTQSTTVGGVTELHPNAYADILTHVLGMPDFFSGAKVLILSDRSITIWEKGIEVQHTTPLCHDHLETLPIRFFLSSVHSIEETDKQTFYGVGGFSQIRYTIIFNDSIKMIFTNEDEYNRTASFLQESRFARI